MPPPAIKSGSTAWSAAAITIIERRAPGASQLTRIAKSSPSSTQVLQ
jgi:hypothetical protein